MGEESEGEKTQQRTVCVRCYRIYGIDERCGVDGPEEDDEYHEDHTDGNVHPFAKAFVAWLTTDVYTVAGGKGCQCGVGTGERGGQDTENKEMINDKG